jgi:hypothetical protein
MNRRPGHVDVTTEVGYCNFCNRTRNLRTEAHHLGTLVRTIVTCETCHRTLSSTMGVAAEEPQAKPEPEPVAAPVEAPAPAKRARAKSATTTKKTAAAKKPAVKKAPPAKPRSTATRKTTKSK